MGYWSRSQEDETEPETRKEPVQGLCRTDCWRIIVRLAVQLLCYVKRNESYETIGGLFAEITKNSVELSVAEKIWLLIVEVINVIAEAFNCDAMALTEQIISNDEQIKTVKEAFDKLAVVAWWG